MYVGKCAVVIDKSAEGYGIPTVEVLRQTAWALLDAILLAHPVIVAHLVFLNLFDFLHALVGGTSRELQAFGDETEVVDAFKTCTQCVECPLVLTTLGQTADGVTHTTEGVVRLSILICDGPEPWVIYTLTDIG